MVQFTDALFVALLAIASSVQAAPVALNKRIQQTTIDAVTLGRMRVTLLEEDCNVILSQLLPLPPFSLLQVTVTSKTLLMPWSPLLRLSTTTLK